MYTDSISTYINNGFFEGKVLLPSNYAIHENYVYGQPFAYTLQSDLLLTILMIVNFVLITFLLINEWDVISYRIKYFFINDIHSSSTIVKSDRELNMNFFSSVLFIVMIITLIYIFIQSRDVGTNEDIVYVLLMSTLCFSVYFLIKNILQKICNWTFFEKEQCNNWNQAYNFNIRLMLITMFFLAIIDVYCGLQFQTYCYILIIIITIYLLITFLKIKQTFFNVDFAYFRTILYFCTLEIIPLFILVVYISKLIA